MSAINFANLLISTILNPLLYVLFSASIIVFIFGLIEVIAGGGIQYGSGSGKGFMSRADGKRHMLYGIIGLFIMLTAYSIIGLVVNTVAPGAWPPSSNSYSQVTPTGGQ